MAAAVRLETSVRQKAKAAALGGLGWTYQAGVAHVADRGSDDAGASAWPEGGRAGRPR